ncbi:rod shape-determining protein MreD [Streptosporangiaceae bacterium NEAU-GS5]|nr:rod shape-determining protein MreD [Streptosporangiaceae bacterium NEAU-GS5]
MRLALLVAVLPLLQVTMADRLPWGGPDLMVLAVVGVALARGPLWGAAYGFAGGLAVDLAPPADHTIGLSALAFCLTGFVCGLRDLIPAASDRPSAPRILAMAATGTYLALILQTAGRMLLDHAPWDPVSMFQAMAWTVAGGSLVLTGLLVLGDRRTRSRRVEPRRIAALSRSVRV